MIVCTARPLLFERHPGWGARGQPNAVRLMLEPLSDDDTAALVGMLVEDATLPKKVEQVLLARAAGNPLYAQEYVRMLVDRGFLRREADGLRLDQSEALPLPESIQGMIAARLDALPHEEKSLLQSAAVVGRAFWFGALAALSDLPHYVVSERLAALERKEFVREEPLVPVSGGSRYAFHHAVVRDVAYGQIPRVSRADKHRLTAEWLETLKSDRADLAEMVAYHYQSALTYARAAGQDTSRLVQQTRLALRDAGHRAAELNSWAVAKRLYEDALALWLHERAHLLFHYGKASFRAEGMGVEALEEARDELLLQNGEMAAEAEVMLGDLEFRQGNHERAFARFDSALALLRRTALALQGPCAQHPLPVSFGRARGRHGDSDGQAGAGDGRGPRPGLRAHALNNIGSARVALADDGGIETWRPVWLSLSQATRRKAFEPSSTSGRASLTLANSGRRSWCMPWVAGRRNGSVTAGMQWFAAERLWEFYWSGRWDEAITASAALIAEVEAGSARSHLEPAARLIRAGSRFPAGGWTKRWRM